MFTGSVQTEAAAAEVRAIAVSLAAHVEALTDANAWSGADADRFRSEWYSEVTAVLYAAAAKLDGIGFEDVLPHA